MDIGVYMDFDGFTPNLIFLKKLNWVLEKLTDVFNPNLYVRWIVDYSVYEIVSIFSQNNGNIFFWNNIMRSIFSSLFQYHFFVIFQSRSLIKPFSIFLIETDIFILLLKITKIFLLNSQSFSFFVGQFGPGFFCNF